MTWLYLAVVLICSDPLIIKDNKLILNEDRLTKMDKAYLEKAEEQCKVRYNACLKKFNIWTLKDGSTSYLVTCKKPEGENDR